MCESECRKRIGRGFRDANCKCCAGATVSSVRFSVRKKTKQASPPSPESPVPSLGSVNVRSHRCINNPACVIHSRILFLSTRETTTLAIPEQVYHKVFNVTQRGRMSPYRYDMAYNVTRVSRECGSTLSQPLLCSCSCKFWRRMGNSGEGKGRMTISAKGEGGKAGITRGSMPRRNERRQEISGDKSNRRRRDEYGHI